MKVVQVQLPEVGSLANGCQSVVCCFTFVLYVSQGKSEATQNVENIINSFYMK